MDQYLVQSVERSQTTPVVQQRVRQRHVEAADSSDEDILARPLSQSCVRLLPFTEKEQWDVWLNRFEDTADQRAWSDVQKLDELMPLLQGAAGDCVWSGKSAGAHKLQ